MNKILVLGNGFDLAHYLPTTYNHFMTAMQAIVKSKNNEITFDELFADYLENNDEFFLKSKELYKTDEFKLSADLVNQFKEKLESNSWFQYFSKYLENVETWIDFESEIERVLGLFCVFFDISKNKYFISNKILVDKTELEINFDFLNQEKEVFLDLFSAFFLTEIKYKSLNLDQYKKLNCNPTYVEKSLFDEYTKEPNKFIKYGTYKDQKITISKVIVTKNKNLKRYKDKFISFNAIEIFKILKNQLNNFKEIFSLYIVEVVGKLQPKKSFKIPKEVDNSLSAVFTFNYSESFQRFYGITPQLIDEVQHLHGNSKAGNIVLGIDDLNDELKPYKIYDFVKTHQKIINNTDFQFLDDERLPIKQLHIKEKLYDSSNYIPYKIIIWGHSLDISDKEYIQDIFRLNAENSMHKVTLEIWHYGTPHTSLANLIHIMGKDIIQNWVKKGWLRFEPTPDIYTINQDNKES